MKAKIFQIDGARDQDGPGIRALVGFCGCPLNCAYCINKEALSSNVGKWYTPDSLLKVLEKDDMYFQATGGGVTFGGGEPALQSEFIVRFREICPPEWTLAIETSLNVPQKHVEALIGAIDYCYVDIKDMNPDIYERYTGKSNQQVKENLRFLANQEKRGEILARIPLIDRYNDFGDQLKSFEELESLHIKYETLTYTKNERLFFNEERLMGALVSPTDAHKNTDGEELKKKQEQLEEELRKWLKPEMGAFEDLKNGERINWDDWD